MIRSMRTTHSHRLLSVQEPSRPTFLKSASLQIIKTQQSRSNFTSNTLQLRSGHGRHQHAVISPSLPSASIPQLVLNKSPRRGISILSHVGSIKNSTKAWSQQIRGLSDDRKDSPKSEDKDQSVPDKKLDPFTWSDCLLYIALMFCFGANIYLSDQLAADRERQHGYWKELVTRYETLSTLGDKLLAGALALETREKSRTYEWLALLETLTKSLEKGRHSPEAQIPSQADGEAD